MDVKFIPVTAAEAEEFMNLCVFCDAPMKPVGIGDDFCPTCEGTLIVCELVQDHEPLSDTHRPEQ